MKPNLTDSAVLTLGTAEREIEMGIDMDSLPFIMQQLTDLYSDPILAVIREYSTNANDSHTFAGQTRPIEVTLPDVDNPHFIVQDWGLGLSEEDIEKTYSKFGASTGRDTNDVTGMLGFGSKAAMTYGNSFRVEASKDGTTLHVVVTKADNGVPRMKIMHTAQDGAPNGVKIIVPVAKNDIVEFAEKAANFYKYWRDPVLVNGGEPKKFYEIDDSYVQVEPDIWVHLGKRGYYAETVSVFVQGGVPYPLEMKEYTKNKVRGSDVFVCYVETGNLDFTPAREALMHTDRTNDLIEVARQCAGESMRRHIAEMGKSKSVFERFKLGFKLPDAYNPLDALGLRQRHYRNGAVAWCAGRHAGDVSRINHDSRRHSHNAFESEFTRNTLDLAQHPDGEYRFVKGFTFKTLTKRHLQSLYAHKPEWFRDEGDEHTDFWPLPESKIVFLPASATFETDSFPGINWSDVELVKVKRRAPKVTTPHIYKVARAENRWEWEIDRVSAADTLVIVPLNQQVAYNVASNWPNVTFVQMPEGSTQKADKARQALAAVPHAVRYGDWKEAEGKRLRDGLTLNDKRWMFADWDLERTTKRFGPYLEHITSARFKKLLLKRPDNEALIRKLGVLYGHPGSVLPEGQQKKLRAWSVERREAIHEEFPLLRRENSVAELVPYINAKSRLKQPIEPNPDYQDINV